MTIREAKSRLISIAASYIGYSEGSNNWNRFAENKDLRSMYGWYPQNQPWCDIFVDAVFIEAFGLDLACGLTYQPKGAGSALCSASASYYKQNKAWYSTPEEGDQVFFYSGGGINHTGIVESVSGNTVRTIEGNSSDSVARRSYSIDNAYIAGYGRPNWSLIATSNTQTSSHKMKYSDNNRPMQCFMTQSTCYRNTSKMSVRGVLIHSTGANNPTLKRYVQPDDNASNRAELISKLGKNQYGNDWNHVEVQAGLNAWVGKLEDGTVTSVQTMPWDYKPWGCGAGANGSCNNGWIQYEICEDSLTDKAYFDAAYKEAIELTAYLCKMYGVNPLGYVSFNGQTVPTILCHKDSANLGLGSDHSDVYHWFNRYGKTMSDVRNDVAALMGSDTSYVTPSTPSSGSSRPMLRKGDNNSYVTELQQSLTKLGYDIGKYGVDGDFGSDTEAAVKKFQSDHSLEVDGVVGNATWSAIDKALKNNTTPPSNSNSGSQASQPNCISIGDVVSVQAGATYYNGKTVPGWVISRDWVVKSISGDRVVIDKSSDGKYGICSPINAKYLKVVSSSAQQSTTGRPIAIGDMVEFSGTKHYINASANVGLPCKPGKANVTKIFGLGTSKHPYHLVAISGGGSTVHGWVDASDVKKV